MQQRELSRDRRQNLDVQVSGGLHRVHTQQVVHLNPTRAPRHALQVQASRGQWLITHGLQDDEQSCLQVGAVVRLRLFQCSSSSSYSVNCKNQASLYPGEELQRPPDLVPVSVPPSLPLPRSSLCLHAVSLNPVALSMTPLTICRDSRICAGGGPLPLTSIECLLPQ